MQEADLCLSRMYLLTCIDTNVCIHTRTQKRNNNNNKNHVISVFELSKALAIQGLHSWLWPEVAERSGLLQGRRVSLAHHNLLSRPPCLLCDLLGNNRHFGFQTLTSVSLPKAWFLPGHNNVRTLAATEDSQTGQL